MMIFAAGRLTSKKALGNGIPLLLQNWDGMRKEYQANPKSPKMLTEELFTHGDTNPDISCDRRLKMSNLRQNRKAALES